MADTAVFLQCLLGNSPGSEIKQIRAVTGSSVSSAAPFGYRGNGVLYKVGIFLDKDTPLDLSDFSSVTLKYQNAFNSGSAEAEVTVASGAITNTITKAGFLAGTEWHFEVQFEDADMNPSLDSLISKEFWMVLSGVKTDTRSQTFGTSKLTLYEDDSETVASPSGGGTAITSAQAQALIDATVGTFYAGTIADGSLTGVIEFGETLAIDSGSSVGVSAGYQPTSGKAIAAVHVVPGSLTTTQVTVAADHGDHGGINVVVEVRP